MASTLYIQQTADGKKHLAKRSIKQGRKPSGLGQAYLQRLDEETERQLLEIRTILGQYYNKNEIVRIAAKVHVNSIYRIVQTIVRPLRKGYP